MRAPILTVFLATRARMPRPSPAAGAIHGRRSATYTSWLPDTSLEK